MDEEVLVVKNRASDYLYNNEGSFQSKTGLENDRLIVTTRQKRKLVLSPALKDEFLFAGFNFDFTRNRDNKVDGFLMDTGPSINVRFVKRK